MGIGQQFKRMGDRAAALWLWSRLYWLVRRPRRLLVALGLVAGLWWLIWGVGDRRGEVHYVHTKRLGLYDQPLGRKVMELQLNDSVVYLGALSESWKRILRDADTLYFKDIEPLGGEVYLLSKIAPRPFDCFDALRGQEVTLQHPDGFYDTGSVIWKNGTRLIVESRPDSDGKVDVARGEASATLPMSYLVIDWGRVLASYPSLQPPQ